MQNNNHENIATKKKKKKKNRNKDEDHDYANTSFFQSYSNDKSADKLARHLHTVNFNMKAEDLDQPWFFRQATRDIALQILRGKEVGTFMARPSSHRGCYAMSYVVENGEIRHDLIYDLYPGFSLYQKPASNAERYWSLSSLVENCAFLKQGLVNHQSNSNVIRNAHTKTIVEVVGRINDRLVANDPSLTELSWSLNVLEGVIGNRTAHSKLERRTYIRYCNDENIAPELLPCNKGFAKLLSQALANNTTLTSLTVNGYEGVDIHKKNFTPNFTSEEAIYLAESLALNKSITKIDLSTNRIDDRGAIAIAHALYSNRTLKRLVLCRNFISSRGISEFARVLIRNFAIEELSIGNQLKLSHGRGVMPASGSEYQRDLVHLIEHSLKRKRELQGRIHGYMEPQAAEAQLQGCLPGSFLFYLRRNIANVIFIACVVDKRKIKEELARGSHRVPSFLKAFVQSGCGTKNNNKKKENVTTIVMHKAIYRVQYGYSFFRTPSQLKADLPSLLECCAWTVCADEELYQTSQLIDVFSEDIREKVEGTKLLQPMWGIKSVPENATNEYSASASTTYFSLELLMKFNSLWLSKPVSLSSSFASPTHTSSMASMFSKWSLSSQSIAAHDCTAPSSQKQSPQSHRSHEIRSNLITVIPRYDQMDSSNRGLADSTIHFSNLTDSTQSINLRDSTNNNLTDSTNSNSSNTTTTATGTYIRYIDLTDSTNLLLTSSIDSTELTSSSNSNSPSFGFFNTTQSSPTNSIPDLSPNASSRPTFSFAHDCAQPP